MRRPGGYAVVTDGFKKWEYDSFTCAHCQHVQFVRAYEKPEDLGGFCKDCMKLICKHCLAKPCIPFEKLLERWERQTLFRQALDGF